MRPHPSQNALLQHRRSLTVETMMRRKPVPETAAVTPHFSLVDQLRGFSVSSGPNVTRNAFDSSETASSLTSPLLLLWSIWSLLFSSRLLLPTTFGTNFSFFSGSCLAWDCIAVLLRKDKIEFDVGKLRHGRQKAGRRVRRREIS